MAAGPTVGELQALLWELAGATAIGQLGAMAGAVTEGQALEAATTDLWSEMIGSYQSPVGETSGIASLIGVAWNELKVAARGAVVWAAEHPKGILVLGAAIGGYAFLTADQTIALEQIRSRESTLKAFLAGLSPEQRAALVPAYLEATKPPLVTGKVVALGALILGGAYLAYRWTR
jgi:hypothetical protein